MKPLALLTAVAAAALVMAAPAGAHIYRSGCTAKLAPKVELACAKLNKQHALASIAWAKGMQRRIVFYDASGALLLHMIIVNHRWLYKVSVQRMAEAEQRLAAMLLPAHNALWECIHPYEASDPHNEDTGGNGHYGGLQMTLNWMRIVPGDPAHFSWLQQKLFAEAGYRNNHYSRAWLQGQWGQTIGPCWRFAN